MSAQLPSFSVAHVRASANAAHVAYQSVDEHLHAVAALAAGFAAKAGIEQAGFLLGMLHDFGKYPLRFQHYILSACGLIVPDDPRYVDPVKNKGRIDHSTAGAQALWNLFADKPNAQPWAQMLALCVASHHSGLLDCIAPDGKNVFAARMAKVPADTHLPEALERCAAGQTETLRGPLPLAAIRQIYSVVRALRQRVAAWLPQGGAACDADDNENSRDFQQGLLARFLLSCLLDADRIDCAQFDDPQWKLQRAHRPQRPWDRLTARLEAHLEGMPPTRDIDHLRCRISAQCARRAGDAPGLFTLTVPTGGGKTLASLRFALRHAQKYDLDRIVYVIPYTSIIDQNAKTAREILEAGEEPGSIVLEHHSNIAPAKEDSEAEDQTKPWERLAENWEAPVVFTTMVQFLESLFGEGSRHARRMHNLARSVIIFDEIQTLPVRCVHMFCNAVDFLVGTCGSSAVLCTATQPRLGNVPRPQLGSLRLTPDREIMDDVTGLFAELRRTDFVNHCDREMDAEGVAALALEEVHASGSCLVVCNTKGWAERVYTLCGEQWKGERYYLSTSLCPAHRMEKLAHMQARLKTGTPVLCVSTQLIECGVDISFGSVIRLAAGLDSILQAAGRCNRHGDCARGRVHIVRVNDAASLQRLEDIRDGQQIFLDMPLVNAGLLAASGGDFTHPALTEAYFDRYFHHRGNVMQYKPPGVPYTLIQMLGSNRNVADRIKPLPLQQSFASAAELFQAIDAPTQAVLVPWRAGAEIIANLCSSDIFHHRKELLRQAQRYSVNIYSTMYKTLEAERALYTIQESGIVSLREAFYDEELGVVAEPAGMLGLQCY